MRTERVVLFPLCVALLAAWVVGLGAQATAVKIAAKDKLTISVWNNGAKEETYSGEYVVDVDGTFEYPAFGRVKVAGLTSRDVEAELKELLLKHLTSPQVTIGLEQTTTKKVIIFGAV